MVDLNAHEAGNGGQMPREAYSPTEAPLLGGQRFPQFLRGWLNRTNTFPDL